MTEDLRPRKDISRQPESPPTLVPPDASGKGEQSPSRILFLMMLACGLLLIIGALLVLFLPVLQKDGNTGPQLESQDVRPFVPPPPPQRQVTPNDDSAREIDRLIGVWLQKQAEAEAVNVAAWGGDAYTEAVSLARECDRLLGEKQYLPAKASCEGAIDGLDDLMASQDRLLEDAVTAGLLALEQGEADAAAAHFQRALAIHADDQRASTGVHRAEQLPAVLRFLQDGLAMEKANNPDGALLAFSEAATLDPDFAPAQEALARVRAAIAETEFQQAMSRALQAMADGKPSAARSALQKAESVKPGDHAVRDLKQQLSRAQLAGRLTALRRDAERLEKEERWPEALESCNEALSLDSHAAFAASCKERVSYRIDLDRLLKTIFAKPERLFEDGPLGEARQTLAHASEVTLPGPILAAQIDQLEKLITQAATEIEVVILSDGLTDVVVYHVGRLGLFQEKSLVLRSGDYTATGSRNGFRDVRQTLKVRPGSGKMVFTLRCEEPI
jgi:tetratricopeptide (TPR) repeat protein